MPSALKQALLDPSTRYMSSEPLLVRWFGEAGPSAERSKAQTPPVSRTTAPEARGERWAVRSAHGRGSSRLLQHEGREVKAARAKRSVIRNPQTFRILRFEEFQLERSEPLSITKGGSDHSSRHGRNTARPPS